ncbi:hypothetical protein IMZ08_15530 [Bacillus luteolus]|uniref:Rhodanese domain-containing protein n=1 Tax=Litchfieldia luteola TaxID=682179 RepID=A0ABR9QLU0_9BACI|nr:rhodanese-like domain-containing protein [Cytobacillus luteolus]MBE4909462.1 hypothetical protein [Cytobacillus luteolus]MBP1940862.1 rhodanese-related sulfurtransferase [Cytobacillus luteolus]
MFLLLIIIITLLFISTFKRYVPVKDVKCISLFSHCQLDNAVLVDVRDYNESSKDQIHESINIPIAYLDRYFREVPENKDIIIVASNKLERNMSIRFFRKSGYKVVGYLLMTERKKSKMKEDVYGVH